MSINGGFTLNGQTARQLGIMMARSSQRPILPDTFDRMLTIPGRNGAWDFGADLGARLFAIDCVMIKTTSATLQQAVSDLAAHLLDQYGKPRTLELVFDMQPDRTYIVRYSGSLAIDRVVGMGSFTLPLMAADPASYAPSDAYDTDLLYDVGLEYDTGLMYPNPNGFNWRHLEQYSSLYNYSSFATGMQIAIDGSVTGGSIKHKQSGRVLHLPVLSDQAMVIDTGKMTIKIDGSNGLVGASGDFFNLVKGVNHLLFKASSANATVEFSWKHKYL